MNFFYSYCSVVSRFFFFIGQVYWVTLADHTKLDLLLQTSATVVTYDAMDLVVADFCYDIYIVYHLELSIILS